MLFSFEDSNMNILLLKSELSSSSTFLAWPDIIHLGATPSIKDKFSNFFSTS